MKWEPNKNKKRILFGISYFFSSDKHHALTAWDYNLTIIKTGRMNYTYRLKNQKQASTSFKTCIIIM